MTKTIPVAQYLFRRLKQLNCHSIHGVPGDFFLRALDHIRPSGLNWIGNANELCAGYAADGYARSGHHVAARQSGQGPKVGALMTTYGVGELSAINAIAGSWAESIPVVHLVGSPPTRVWRAGNAARPVHHSLGDGRMEVYAEMAKQITCAQSNFNECSSVSEAVQAYDEVLSKCVLTSKPGYVSVPCDMFEAEVPAELLEKPLAITPPENDRRMEEDVVARLAGMLTAAQRSLIVADGLSYPFDFVQEANDLAKMIPSACFTSGKGAIQETAPHWVGPLTGGEASGEPCDVVMILGPLLSDTNTAAWTAIPPASTTVLFNQDSIAIDGEVISLRSKSVLRQLITQLETSTSLAPRQSHKAFSDGYASRQTSQAAVTQDSLWPTINAFLRPNDTVILANGTPLIGGRDMHLPSQTQIVASSIWCSIGQMLPAAQGVALAKRESGIPGRTILFEGDGSFQTTCQSLSDIIRYKLDVTIFMVNNAGYTYERWLNGMEAEYNDVPAWSYTQIPNSFGAEGLPDYPVLTKRVTTMHELQDVLADHDMHNGRGLKLMDIVLAPDDVPKKAKAGLRRASNAIRSAP